MNEEETERCDLKGGKKNEETEIKEKGGIGSSYQYRSPSQVRRQKDGDPLKGRKRRQTTLAASSGPLWRTVDVLGLRTWPSCQMAQRTSGRWRAPGEEIRYL
jgi:hypothetical protein